MAAYLAGKVKDLGIREVRTIVVPNRETMAEYLRDGKVDFLSETVLTALYLEKHGKSQILMREWKKGVSNYRSIIVVAKDSGISKLSDLRGRKIAFEDQSSTSGFLLPYAAMVREGLTFRRLSSPRSTVPTGKIGYVFAEEELNIAGWVVRGIVAAGAMSDRDFASKARTPGPIKARLKVIYKSPLVPRSLFSARRSLDSRIKARIKAVMLKIHKQPDAKRVLKKYYKVKKFDEVLQLDHARKVYGVLQASRM
jgi:phosphonate transport system substrate-binding protein